MRTRARMRHNEKKLNERVNDRLEHKVRRNLIKLDIDKGEVDEDIHAPQFKCEH